MKKIGNGGSFDGEQQQHRRFPSSLGEWAGRQGGRGAPAQLGQHVGCKP